MVKKILKAFIRFILISLLSLLLLIGVLRHHKVQSFIAKVSSSVLSEQLGVNVWIDRVYITSYFNILLDNVQVYDHHEQPLITAKSLQIKYNIFQP
ncbi:MAG: hypothetical protein GQ527_03875, partial [Bacteroidales bacterium]|nr:hypothetical protein [Bacteroidales bacterium]